MDVYLEHMIRKRPGPIAVVATILLYLAALIISVIIFISAMASPILMNFSLPIAAALFVGAWWISSRFHLEYEYIMTNNELDVDKIIAKRSRRRVLTVDISKFDIMEKAEGDRFEGYKRDPEIRVKLDASSGAGSVNRYYAVFINKMERRMLLIFNPTRKMLNEMKRLNPLRVVIND